MLAGKRSLQRVIDDVSRFIDRDFLFAIKDELQDRLIEGLELGSDHATERATAYLAEEEHITANRQKLQRKLERLEMIQRKFWAFGA